MKDIEARLTALEHVAAQLLAQYPRVIATLDADFAATGGPEGAWAEWVRSLVTLAKQLPRL